MPGCCGNGDCTETTCMTLPEGETCSDCVHFCRCSWLISCDATRTRCDWYPRRFRPIRDVTVDVRIRARVSTPAMLGAGMNRKRVAVATVRTLLTRSPDVAVEEFQENAASDLPQEVLAWITWRMGQSDFPEGLSDEERALLRLAPAR